MGHVQDRYAGDLGDFLKLGFLRWLVPVGTPAFPRFGVVWYRTASETHNADGKCIAYLNPAHGSSALLRRLDPDLYDRLASVVAAENRSTAALAGAGVLNPGTRFFGDLLDFAGLPVTARGARQARRRSWMERALAATVGCDLIFADPDNGIRGAHHAVPAYRTRAVKHAYLDELAEFALRRQSLIVYHHTDRSEVVEQQARRRLEDLARKVPLEPIAAVRASRGTTRLFLVAANAAHAQYLTGRLTALATSPWKSELTVYWSLFRSMSRSKTRLTSAGTRNSEFCGEFQPQAQKPSASITDRRTVITGTFVASGRSAVSVVANRTVSRTVFIHRRA